MTNMILKHFKMEEFQCSCCGKTPMDHGFLSKLDKARSVAKVPFIINSGYRCEKHNKSVNGHPNSAHMRGYAVDIKCSTSRDRFRILNALLVSGFHRIGVDVSFIHCDTDPGLPSNVVWTY